MIDQQKLRPFLPLELLARQVVEGFITGLHKSPFHGFSVEFAEHRIYNSGESTRHIDWKLFGRTEKLFTKRFEEETNLRCRIIIDNSSSMYYPEVKDLPRDGFSKITFSVYAAAALIQLLKKQRDAVGLSLFSDKVELHSQAKSTTVHHKYLFNELEKIVSAAETKISRKKTFAVESLHGIAENIHHRSLVVMFSDMMENSSDIQNLLAALQHLRHNKHEVILFHVFDGKKEIDFDFENRPYRFIDMETGEELKLTPSEVRDDYRKSVSELQKTLLLKCGQYHIDFIRADVNKGLTQILLPYLLKRIRMQ
ncbi:MAG: DUF58 domain-containing protein [Bacteroidetes bacterium]|nr:DUF58 domain-containing protein [Bacteroidota bacterium]